MANAEYKIKIKEPNSVIEKSITSSVGTLGLIQRLVGMPSKTMETCGGFLLTGTTFVTAYHCIKQEMAAYESAEVWFGKGDKKVRVLGVLAQDKASDLAVLELSATPTGMKPAKLAKSVSVGESICAVRQITLDFITNMPSDITADQPRMAYDDRNCSSVSSVNKLIGTPYQIIKSKQLTEPGFSGFPVLNSRGEVMGVTSSGSNLFSNVSLVGNIWHTLRSSSVLNLN